LVPELALNLLRGCGNPTGFANLQLGDVVVDFGSGGGIDVILAAHKVGSRGRVIGIDFASQMIERAKQTVAEMGFQDRNIELRVSDMTRTQLPDRFADVVISNCVINLCPDKDAVYQEAFRILGPKGGSPSQTLPLPRRSILNCVRVSSQSGQVVWVGPFRKRSIGRWCSELALKGFRSSHVTPSLTKN